MDERTDKELCFYLLCEKFLGGVGELLSRSPPQTRPFASSLRQIKIYVENLFVGVDKHRILCYNLRIILKLEAKRKIYAKKELQKRRT